MIFYLPSLILLSLPSFIRHCLPYSLVIPPLPTICSQPTPPERSHLLPYDPNNIRGYSKPHIHSPFPTLPPPPSAELHSLVTQQQSIHPNTLIATPQFLRNGLFNSPPPLPPRQNSYRKYHSLSRIMMDWKKVMRGC